MKPSCSESASITMLHNSSIEVAWQKEEMKQGKGIQTPPIGQSKSAKLVAMHMAADDSHQDLCSWYKWLRWDNNIDDDYNDKKEK